MPEEKHLTYREPKIRIISDFSSKITQTRRDGVKYLLERERGKKKT